MEAMYVNETTMDKSTCRDFMSLTWPQNGGWLRKVMWGVAALAVVYAGALIWQYGTGDLLYVVALLLMAAAAVFLAQWGWLLRLGRYTRGQQAAWGGATLEKTLTFEKSGITQESRLGTLHFSYEALTALSLGTQVLILWMGNQVILLSRSGFTTGSETDFIAFAQAILKQNKRRRKYQKNTEN